MTTTGTAAAGARVRALAYALTVLLSVGHLGQAIVTHRWSPGNLGDARLGNYILEHVYRWYCGHGQLLSPSQFYPTKHTLVYSDNHFGTSAVYAMYRVLGTSRETAYQLWFLTVAGINSAAFLYAMRRFAIPALIACPLTFFATASAPLVYKMGHPQALPLFPFIFALSSFLTLVQTGSARALVALIGWIAYQNFCYLYYGYFSILIFAAAFVVFAAIGSTPTFWQRLIDSLRANAPVVIVALAIAVLAVGLLYWPYVRFANQSGTRPIVELMQLAPRPIAWCRASPFSLWYSHQAFAAEYPIESTFFGGWAIYGVLVLTAIIGVRAERRSLLRVACACAITVIATGLVITTWSDATGYLYVYIASFVPSIRAFRSFGRIVYLLLIMEAVTAALVLNYLRQRSKSVTARITTVIIAFGIAVENISIGQEAYDPRVAQARSAAVFEAWKNAGGRDVLAFAPGYSNQSTDLIHLDCWGAALTAGKHCINGYSGNEPAGYGPFLHTPNVANAEAILLRLNIPRAKVSVVTDWPDDRKAALGLHTYRFTPKIVPRTSTTELHLRPLQITEVPATLDSHLADDLPCDSVGVFASYRVYTLNGLPADDPPSLRTIVGTIPAGGSVPIMLRMQAPSHPGVYEARLSMVHEGVLWWADAGAAGSKIIITVRE
jgi:hypothetical protein